MSENGKFSFPRERHHGFLVHDQAMQVTFKLAGNSGDSRSMPAGVFAGAQAKNNAFACGHSSPLFLLMPLAKAFRAIAKAIMRSSTRRLTLPFG